MNLVPFEMMFSDAFVFEPRSEFDSFLCAADKATVAAKFGEML
jgi:hypothetical protein